MERKSIITKNGTVYYFISHANIANAHCIVFTHGLTADHMPVQVVLLLRYAAFLTSLSSPTSVISPLSILLAFLPIAIIQIQRQ